MIAIDLIKCPRSDTIGTRQARPSYGCAGTICPGQTVWLRRLRRCMLGYEKLALQGFGHDDVVKLLLKRGVSKKRENKLGETPFEVGKKYGKTLCCEILELPFGAF